MMSTDEDERQEQIKKFKQKLMDGLNRERGVLPLSKEEKATLEMMQGKLKQEFNVMISNPKPTDDLSVLAQVCKAYAKVTEVLVNSRA